MADTKDTHTGDGTTVDFTFTFPYIKQTDVKASINGTDTTEFTFHNATTIRFNSAPANDAAIIIYRSTSSSNLVATFYPGSAIRSTDLNDNFTQNLYVTQEASEAVGSANTDSAAALALATTADGKADTALANSQDENSTPSSAIHIAQSAEITANAAKAQADAAEDAINEALPYEIVPNKAAFLLEEPSENTLYEVTSSFGLDNSTGGTINWVTAAGVGTTLADEKPGVLWDAGITLKAKKYGTTTNDKRYVFISYFANDSEDRYGSSTVVQNVKTISSNFEIKSDENGDGTHNALSVGPVVVADGATLTIPNNSRYVVL